MSMQSHASSLRLRTAVSLDRLFIGLLVFLFSMSFVSAQSHRREGFVADIPFEFQAGKKTLEAGSYSFTFDRSARTVTVTGQGKDYARLTVITRLGARSSSEAATLIFDKINGQRTLSEVWIPNLDGILVHITPKEHAHEVVRVVVEVALL